MFLPFAEAISEATPRVVSESRARKLCNEMKRCTYYETCAANGLSVDDVFDDGKSIKTVDLYWHTNQLWSGLMVSVSYAETSRFVTICDIFSICDFTLAFSTYPFSYSSSHSYSVYFLDSLQANSHDAQFREHAQPREWPEFSPEYAKPHWRLPKHVQ